jgi:PD-(D/E)XK endonuclease
MKKHRIDIQHPKARGEWAELRFMARATELGLRAAKPWGDTAPYDVATEHQGRFLRVQVKCTWNRHENSYQCRLDANGLPYRPDQIDFFAAYVIDPDVWYILPLAATNNQTEILLSPHRKKSKYAAYKEAWHLLMCEP